MTRYSVLLSLVLVMFHVKQEYFAKNGEPLFSSHMLDLSEEVDEENISTCKSYLERMAKMKVRLPPWHICM